MKKTKIVCTIGPASENKEILTEMIKAGMNAARLNFSHGTHEEHKKRIDLIKEVRSELGAHIAIILDTKGPEIRTGKFNEKEVQLNEGSKFTLTTRDIIGNSEICKVSYKELPQDVHKGDRILIDDGLIELEVLDVQEEDIQCIVKNSGVVKDNKGVNVPGVKINLPAITDKDREDILFAIENDLDFIAASFVRTVSDVLEIRRILEENKGNDIRIISKIENEEGVENLSDIIDVSDGIMVARGDLGVEIPPERVPLIQKKIIKECNCVGKPVIIATQMLDSMIRNPRPTRAEVTDVATAIFDGTDAIMLSGETAAGKYPLEAVKTMDEIAMTTEDALDYEAILREKGIGKDISITDAISHATCTSAYDLKAAAILTATATGYTSAMVSKFRPKAPIIASTVNEKMARRMSIIWGTYPVITDAGKDTEEIFDKSIEKSIENGFFNSGDLIIITAGVPVGISGTTNMMKVHIVGKVLVKGMSIGKESVVGTVCVVKDAAEAAVKFKEGDILVTYATDKDMIAFMEKASGVIVEEGGITSHAAVVGISLHKPTIVGAENAVSILEDGMLVTMDTLRGLVYSGKTTVL